jgi:hypothetical protein
MSCVAMPMKKRRTNRKSERVSKGPRIGVTRGEFNRVADVLKRHGDILDDLRANQGVQLTRIAQIQSELDRLTKLTNELRRLFHEK